MRGLLTWAAAWLALSLSAAPWDDIAPADLAATDSSWSPGADAEMLIDRQIVIADDGGAKFLRYQRTKIYTAKGVEDAGKLAFEYPGTATISGLEARVVKQDGRIIELKKSDFFVSDVARRFGRKLKKTSMVFPDLAPGDIVECRWRESIPDGLVNAWDYCQRPIPVRDYSMMIAAEGYDGLLISWYNTPNAKPVKRGGRTGVEAQHLPPFEEEEFAPPERDLRGWVWINYGQSIKDDRKWKEVNRENEVFFRNNIGVNDDIRTKVAEVTQGATTDDDRLRRLYEFCRRSITNYVFYESADIQKSVKKRESGGFDFQPAKRTLERGGGFGHEIDYLFAAMASAAGYEVRQVLYADRDEVTNINVFRGWGLLDSIAIGVQVAGEWRYFTPGRHIVPYGLLPWQAEGARGAVSSKGDVSLVLLPASSPDVSRSQRVGRFTLDAEGTLEGTVEETILGHQAVAMKRTYWPLNDEECRNGLEKRVTDRLSTAEVSDISWEHLNDLEYPVVIRYKVRVPAYADLLGERLMLDPSYFEHARAPIFAAETRKHPIMLEYTFSEHDDIEIVLPEGHVLDQPSAPRPVADGSGFVKSDYTIRFSKKTGTLRYARMFTFGLADALGLNTEAYPTLKALLNAVHESDSHALLIKPADGPVQAAQPPAGP